MTALTVLGTLPIGGCSGAPSATGVDTASIRPSVADQLNRVGFTVTSIDCPPGADVSSDATVECSVALGDGSQVAIEVGATDDKGRRRLTWKLGHDLVVTDGLVGDLTAFAHGAVSDDLSVTCPRAIVLPGGNGRLSCDVSDGKGQSATVVVPLVGGQPVADRDQWSVDQT
jgi:hypothetical protein